jgi:hypothetical protein
MLGVGRPIQGGATHLDHGRLAHKNSSAIGEDCGGSATLAGGGRGKLFEHVPHQAHHVLLILLDL